MKEDWRRAKEIRMIKPQEKPSRRFAFVILKRRASRRRDATLLLSRACGSTRGSL
jgi:hypothetical protein